MVPIGREAMGGGPCQDERNRAGQSKVGGWVWRGKQHGVQCSCGYQIMGGIESP